MTIECDPFSDTPCMSDHSIVFTPEQNLYLDKIVADRAQAEKRAEKLERDLATVQERLNSQREDSRRLREQLETSTDETASASEEEIRASERERIAIWFDMRGNEDEHFYQSWGNGVSVAAGSMADAIRRRDHYLTYYEYRKGRDPEWPEAYSQQPEDYEFDVHTRVWERYVDDSSGAEVQVS